MDLVAVAEVAEAIKTHGDRYLRRVYTPREVADCANDPAGLAARFAAKEGVRKVLRGDGVGWPSVEVVLDADGAPSLRLSGRAAELAAAAGLVEFSVSLTHEAGLAAAVVVASS